MIVTEKCIVKCVISIKEWLNWIIFSIIIHYIFLLRTDFIFAKTSRYINGFYEDINGSELKY